MAKSMLIHQFKNPVDIDLPIQRGLSQLQIFYLFYLFYEFTIQCLFPTVCVMIFEMKI